MAVTWDFSEEPPMTMQIAIRASDGFLLASDTKRQEEPFTISPHRRTRQFTNRSKITVATHHNIAIALAGTGLQETDPEIELAKYLDELKPEEELDPALERWVEGFIKSASSHPYANAETPIVTFLLVNPNCKRYPLRRFRTSEKFYCDVSLNTLHSGDLMNPALFWLDYFQCANRIHNLESCINIAALFLSTAALLNPSGVGGLEIRTFKTIEGKWEIFDTSKLGSQTEELQKYIDSVIVKGNSLLRRD
jgi:hypothetical protein